MEVNSPTRQSFPSGGQRLRKAPAPPWQGLIIERHESSPLPILCVLCIGIRVPAVSQEVRGTDRCTTGSCYYNKRWNCDSAVNVLVPWGLEWAGIKAPWQVNSSLLREKPDPWPLDLVMVRSDGFRKLLSRMSKTENKGLKCVCSHESGRWSWGPQSVAWSRWEDVRVFSVQQERDGVVVLLASRPLQINGFSFSIYQYPESYFTPPSQVN